MEAEERDQTVLSRLDGLTILGSEEISRVLVDGQGGRSFHTVRRRVRGPDGRVVANPDETFACRCGRDLLSFHAVVFCTVCQYAMCRTCAKTADDGTTKLVVCASCYEHGKWSRAIKRVFARVVRFIGWLAKI
jgi:hypothetical protein